MRRAIMILCFGCMLCWPCYPKNIISGAKALLGKIKSTIQSSVNSALPDVEVKWQEDDRHVTLEEIEHSITNSLHTVRSELRDIIHDFDERIDREVSNVDQHIFTYIDDAEERMKHILEQIDTMADSKIEYVIYQLSTIIDDVDHICTQYLDKIGNECDELLTNKLQEARTQLEEMARTIIEAFSHQLEIYLNQAIKSADDMMNEKIAYVTGQMKSLLSELNKLCSLQQEELDTHITHRIQEAQEKLDNSMNTHLQRMENTLCQAICQCGYTICGSGATLLGLYILSHMCLYDTTNGTTSVSRWPQGSFAAACIVSGITCIAYSDRLANSTPALQKAESLPSGDA